WREAGAKDLQPLLEREWLVTNGLGGYASGTISGATTRRYHGLLIAAHPAPLGRVMMLNHLSEYVRLPDYSTAHIGARERVGGDLEVHGSDHLVEFRLEAGLPVWRFEVRGFVLERRVYLPHQQNTVYITSGLLQGEGAVRLKLQPSVHFRGHDDSVGGLTRAPYVLTAVEDRYELTADDHLPKLRLWIDGADAAFTLKSETFPDIL